MNNSVLFKIGVYVYIIKDEKRYFKDYSHVISIKVSNFKSRVNINILVLKLSYIVSDSFDIDLFWQFSSSGIFFFFNFSY